MHGFVAVPDGYASRLDAMEREILARVIDDVTVLIADDTEREDATEDGEEDPIGHLDFDPTPPGDAVQLDPALARVFPPMSLTDPELAGEMRSLTMDELRRAKLANLDVVAASLRAGVETVRVSTDEVPKWLAALTDVRLVLAARLGIESDADSQRVYDLAVSATADEAMSESLDREMELALASLYSGLTWWQESLLSAVSRG